MSERLPTSTKLTSKTGNALGLSALSPTTHCSQGAAYCTGYIVPINSCLPELLIIAVGPLCFSPKPSYSKCLICLFQLSVTCSKACLWSVECLCSTGSAMRTLASGPQGISDKKCSGRPPSPSSRFLGACSWVFWSVCCSWVSLASGAGSQGGAELHSSQPLSLASLILTSCLVYRV